MPSFVFPPDVKGYITSFWYSNIVLKVGTNDYVFLLQANLDGGGDGKIHVFKRIAVATTWNEMDAGNAINVAIVQTYIPFAGGSQQYCCWVDGAILYFLILRQHSTAGPNFFIDGWDIFTFNTTTDTWNTTPTSFSNPSTGTTVGILYDASAVPGSVSLCYISMFVRGPGDYIFYHSGATEVITAVQYGRLYYSTFNGTTFGTDVLIPGQAGISDRFWGQGGIHDTTNGDDHFFYSPNGNATPNIYHVGLHSGGFGSTQIVNSSNVDLLYYKGDFAVNNVTRPIVYRVGGAGAETIAIGGEFFHSPFDGSQDLLFFNAPVAQNPTWTTHVVSSGSDDTSGGFPWWSDNNLFPVHQDPSTQACSISAQLSTGVLIFAWVITDQTTFLGHIFGSQSTDNGSTWVPFAGNLITAEDLSANDNAMFTAYAYSQGDGGVGVIASQLANSAGGGGSLPEATQWAFVIAGSPAPPPTTISASCNSPIAARVGVAYSHTFTASGGTPPYTFAVTSGFLPFGLTLNPTTGILSGTPTHAGVFFFTITATDANGITSNVSCNIPVTCP